MVVAGRETSSSTSFCGPAGPLDSAHLIHQSLHVMITCGSRYKRRDMTRREKTPLHCDSTTPKNAHLVDEVVAADDDSRTLYGPSRYTTVNVISSAARFSS
ncbi:hypothetical protein Aduo_000038 [Ancylostoma duodenale]